MWSGGGEAVDGSDGLGNSSSTNYHPGALNYIFLPPLFTAHSSFSGKYKIFISFNPHNTM